MRPAFTSKKPARLHLSLCGRLQLRTPSAVPVMVNLAIPALPARQRVPTEFVLRQPFELAGLGRRPSLLIGQVVADLQFLVWQQGPARTHRVEMLGDDVRDSSRDSGPSGAGNAGLPVSVRAGDRSAAGGRACGGRVPRTDFFPTEQTEVDLAFS